MNLPLCNEQFQVYKIYILFINMLVKLICIISLVRGSLHSVLEGTAECRVFTERLYRVRIC